MATPFPAEVARARLGRFTHGSGPGQIASRHPVVTRDILSYRVTRVTQPRMRFAMREHAPVLALAQGLPEKNTSAELKPRLGLTKPSRHGETRHARWHEICLLRRRPPRGAVAPPSTRRKERCMRIAQIAPLYEQVPPRYYGGTERVVSLSDGGTRPSGA